MSPKEAQRLILSGQAPPDMRVSGPLSLANAFELTSLPRGLTVDVLDVSGCSALRTLPHDLRVRRLNLSGSGVTELPEGLRCYELEMRQTAVRALPEGLAVEYRLDLQDCRRLETLPEVLKVGTLVLSGCTALQSLPEGLCVYFLDLSGCTSLGEWPRSASIGVGRLTVAGCWQLSSLPPWLDRLSQVDLRDCVGITTLPEGLQVSSWIDLAGTGIRSLPGSLRGVELRWRGVPVDERIAFHPEQITAAEVLRERNAERRRVLLERMGYAAFLAQTQAQVLDQDQDAGGERRLLRVPLPGDEDLVCVSVICPSTGRQYLLRVPPTMRTCRQAVAWTAGFDDAEQYRPLRET